MSENLTRADVTKTIMERIFAKSLRLRNDYIRSIIRNNCITQENTNGCFRYHGTVYTVPELMAEVLHNVPMLHKMYRPQMEKFKTELWPLWLGDYDAVEAYIRSLVNHTFNGADLYAVMPKEVHDYAGLFLTQLRKGTEDAPRLTDADIKRIREKYAEGHAALVNRKMTDFLLEGDN